MMPVLGRRSKVPLCFVVLALLPAGICRAQEKAPAATYPNSVDGLRERLSDLLVMAKTMDQSALAALLKNEMEIPNFPAWFNKTYGKSDGKDFAEGYRMNVDYDEFRFAGLLKQLAQSEVSIFTRKINDDAEPVDAAEMAKLDSMNKPADIYFASFLAPGSASPQRRPIGYFMFIGGAFRWDNAGSKRFLPTPSPDNSQTESHALNAVAQSSGASSPDIHAAGKGGVGHPACMYCPNPAYSLKARSAAIQGTVILDVVVLPSGLASDITVKRSLGYGLDGQAIAAVKTWRFIPARRDGLPVAVETPIEVTFRLPK